MWLTLIINPYWQILENASKIFAEISVFWIMSQIDFLKTNSFFSRNFNFRVIIFGKSMRIIWVPWFENWSGWDFQKSISVTPENRSTLWFGWVFQKSVQRIPQKFAKNSNEQFLGNISESIRNWFFGRVKIKISNNHCISRFSREFSMCTTARIMRHLLTIIISIFSSTLSLN